MPVAQHVATRLEHIDREILALLVQRVRAYEDASEDMEENEILEDPFSVQNAWVETAEENGLDPALTERAAQVAMALCRKARQR